MSLSDPEVANIYLARAITGSVSLVCSTSILLIFFSFKDLHFFYMRLIIFMIISDIIFSASALIVSRDDVSCYISAMMLEFGSLSSVCWAFMISLALYIGITNQSREIENKTLYFMLAGYGIPGIFTLLPVCFGIYGMAGGWCWISIAKNYKVGSALRIICYYGPLFILLILVCIVYIKIILTIRQLMEGFAPENSDSPYKYLVYPSIILICNTPVATLRLIQLATHNESQYYLSLVGIISLMSTGACNALAYGFNSNVKQAIRDYCNRRRSRSISMSDKSFERYSAIVSTF